MFDVSNNAIKRIKEISQKQKEDYFRISVDGGGCHNCARRMWSATKARARRSAEGAQVTSWRARDEVWP